VDDLLSGRTLGPYTLVEMIGAGASAVVYLAKDQAGQEWAVKVRRRGDPAMDRRFLREFESMRLLRLPGVVRVHEAGIEDDALWFSMDLVWGQDFIDVVREERQLSSRVSRALSLGARLFEILGDLHEAGFTHRDVKPSNVLVAKGGDVTVLDFGIGMYFSDQANTLSQTGQVLGTIPYMAPEQIAGLPVDHRIDLYAGGLMLWESLAGRRPPPATTVGWVSRICTKRLEPLACHYRQVPLGLSKLLEQLTHANPDQRPSASEAAASLHALMAEDTGPEWPDPPFIDPGPWWLELEGCLGLGDVPVWVLEGDAGSGKSRLAEQIHREGLLQGVWPIHLRCAVDEVGGPIASLLQELLNHPEVGDHVFDGVSGLLRRMWPHLPLPGHDLAPQLPSLAEISAAVARVLKATTSRQHVLLVIHNLEQVDDLSAPCIDAIAEHAGMSLGILALHDKRWRTPQSNRLCKHLEKRGGRKMSTRKLTAAQANQLSSRLSPKIEPPPIKACHPVHAVGNAHRQLARWRGMEPPEPTNLWAYAVLSPLPERVAAELGVMNANSPWVTDAGGGLAPSGETARMWARVGLKSLKDGARDVAAAFDKVLGPSASPEVLAKLYLLARDGNNAWEPVAAAAAAAVRTGRFNDARKWLLVLDTLSRYERQHDRFALAMVRARVALHTEPGIPRRELVRECEDAASTQIENDLAKILMAEFQLRMGQTRAALVSTLRLASPALEPTPEVAVRALLVAAKCRIALRQHHEASQQLARAQEMVDANGFALLALGVLNLRAELALTRHDLNGSRQLSQRLVRDAATLGDLRGVAWAGRRLGQVLRVLGRRQEAEHHTRSAGDALTETGEIAPLAENGLLLATLMCERGDTVGARVRLDDTIRSIRGLRMDHLLPAAMRVILHIATLRADVSDASIAIAGFGPDAARLDPEVPATLVRWWRTRGDIDRALAIPGPAEHTFGHCLWTVERARAALAAGNDELAMSLAGEGLTSATTLRFSELAVYARMLIGVTDNDDGRWKHTMGRASRSANIELYLGALEMSARRLSRRNDEAGSRMKWRNLRARAEELGYQPGLQEAAGWL
jgi:tRNA A-37 threonylcarbamoyl transferase component Bud32